MTDDGEIALKKVYVNNNVYELVAVEDLTSIEARQNRIHFYLTDISLACVCQALIRLMSLRSSILMMAMTSVQHGQVKRQPLKYGRQQQTMYS